jgi:hypothetical protein
MDDSERRLARVIRADGSIARGYLIDRCQLKSANEYVITWKIPLQGTAKTNFSCVIGSTEYEPVEPGFCSVGLLEDPMKTRVCPLACFHD